MTLKTIGQRLRFIRKEAGLKQPEFAKSIGISQGHLSSLESDKVGMTDTISIVIKYVYSINRRWLTTGEGDPSSVRSNEATPIREARGVYASDASRLTDFTLVPHYDIEASAGHGSVVRSEQVVDHLAFKTTWIKRDLGLNPNVLVLISAVGDSMEPTIHAGDLLLLNREMERIADDAIYCIVINETLVVKRVQHLFDGTVVIKSDNPAYSDQKLTAEEAGLLHVVGRLVWVGSMV